MEHSRLDCWHIVFCWIGLVWFWLFGQKEARRTAQRTAQTERGRCTAATNSFEMPHALLSSKIRNSNASEPKKTRLLGELNDVKGRYETAVVKMAGINRGQNDPDTPNLSVKEYENMAESYRKIANDLESIPKELARIERKLNDPESPNPPEDGKPHQPKPTPSSAGHQDTTKKGKASDIPKASAHNEVPPQPSQVATPAPTATTTEHHHYHDCGSGIIVINNDNGGGHRDIPHYDQPSSPHYEPIPSTTTSRGNGEESSFGGASAGNGGETTWGASTSGNGGHQSGMHQTSAHNGKRHHQCPLLRVIVVRLTAKLRTAIVVRLTANLRTAIVTAIAIAVVQMTNS